MTTRASTLLALAGLAACLFGGAGIAADLGVTAIPIAADKAQAIGYPAPMVLDRQGGFLFSFHGLEGSSGNRLRITRTADFAVIQDRNTSAFLSRQVSDAALAPNQGWLYAVDRGAATLAVMDVVSFRASATLPVGGALTRMAIHPDGSRIYLLDTGAGTVPGIVVIDAVRMVVLGRRALHLQAVPADIAIDSHGQALYVSLPRAGAVHLFNPTTLQQQGAIEGMADATSLSLDSSGRRLVVAGAQYRELHLVDTVAGQVLQTFPLVADGYTLGEVAQTPDGSRAFAVLYRVTESGVDDGIAVIDLWQRVVLGSFAPGGGRLTISPDNGRLYVSDNPLRAYTITPAAVPRPEGFGATLAVEQESYGEGDLHTLSLGFEGDATLPVDIYIALTTPFGATYSLAGTGLQGGATSRFATGIEPEPGAPQAIYSLRLPQLPEGEYRWHVVVVPAGRGPASANRMLHETASWSFGP